MFSHCSHPRLEQRGHNLPVTAQMQVRPCGAGGARTDDRQIMRSTLVGNTRLTGNDASRGCQERTRHWECHGQRSTPRSTPGGPPRAITVTQRKRTGMEPPGGLPASPPSCVATAVGPCQLVLSAWEAGDTGLQCGLSCGGKRPRLTTRDRSSPGLMARGRGAAWRWPCPAPPTWSTPSPRTPPIPARRPSPWTAWPTRTWRRSTTIRP
jgi:hypothetical protein